MAILNRYQIRFLKYLAMLAVILLIATLAGYLGGGLNRGESSSLLADWGAEITEPIPSETSLTQIHQRVVNLEARQQLLKRALSTVGEQYDSNFISSLDSRVNNLERSVSTLKSDVGSPSYSFSSLESRVGRLESRLSSLSGGF